MAYTLFLAPMLQTTQHTLDEEYKPEERANSGCEHPVASFATWKLETSILPYSVSDLSHPPLRYISYLCNFLCSRTSTRLLIFVPLYMRAAHRHRETSLLEVLSPDRR